MFRLNKEQFVRQHATLVTNWTFCFGIILSFEYKSNNKYTYFQLNVHVLSNENGLFFHIEL